MKITLGPVTIIRNGSKEPTKKYIDIENGVISKISDRTSPSNELITSSNLFVSIGWFDGNVTSGEPGLEHKEDWKSLELLAAKSGYTDLAVLPNTNPIIQTKEHIRAILTGNGERIVNFWPIAALSNNLKGEELAEIIDLHTAGAIAFSDSERPINNADLLIKALNYVQDFQGIILNKAEDLKLNLSGQMHEGVTSTRLGMKGMPRLAEEISIERDLRLLEYAGGKLHFSSISTAGAVNLIRIAKSKGINITADVNIWNLIFTCDELESFNTNFKLNPPLREQSDIDGLKAGIKDGTIDFITSAHKPHDEESKNLEFDLAEFGAISLQTIFPLLIRTGLPLELIIEKIAECPRSIFNRKIAIKEGEIANLTLFDPDVEWKFDLSNNFSKSKNSPILNTQLKGKAVGIISGNRSIFDQDYFKSQN